MTGMPDGDPLEEFIYPSECEPALGGITTGEA